MRRLSLWMKAHPIVGDSAVLVFIGGLEVVTLFNPPTSVGTLWYFLVAFALLIPLVIRRRHPVLFAYAVLAAGAVQLLTHGAPADPSMADARIRLADITLGIALYTLVAYVGRRTAAWYAVWLGIGTTAWAVWRLDSREKLIGAVVVTIFFALCWVLGEFVGARRAYLEEVERRLVLLETERDQQARIAVGEERARIARELHDVVAHAVSVIVVQADGAAFAVRTQPDLAERAVKTISATGREALTELRRLLGVLRSDEGDRERTPQPGTQSLSELAERVRAVGLPVRLEIVGAVDDLPAGVGLGVYRIVQEALTNILKHAGPGASALVRVERTADRVELNVFDDGLTGRPALVGVSGGNGLIGMRERAHVFGGSLSAGPDPGGGWRVRAVLPFSTG